jgi:glucose/arabinose dehydrogenase
MLAAAGVLSAACDDTPAFPDPTGGGSLEIVAEGLQSPVFLTAPSAVDDILWVVEQIGRIRVITRDDGLRPMPFLDITDLVSDGGERGLLSVAFHPNFLVPADDRSHAFVYVNYTDTNGDTRIVRYSLAPNTLLEADPASATVLMTIPQPFGNHNGGQLAFGPDGMLYIAMGDGGSGGDPLEHGQDRSTLLGAMLRIDVDGALPYVVPSDNPFVGDPSSAPEIWVYGLRNPWRFSFDRQDGGLYIADVGQNALEEVSFQSPGSGGGENYGWNTMEGTACFGTSDCDSSGLELPIHEYGHDEGCSITGGYVYRGPSAPSLVGRYFYADFCSSWVRSFRLEGGEAVDHFDHSTDFGPLSGVVSFGEDARGDMYIITLSGTVYRIVEPE